MNYNSLTRDDVDDLIEEANAIEESALVARFSGDEPGYLQMMDTVREHRKHAERFRAIAEAE